jgi:hypothetical protein
MKISSVMREEVEGLSSRIHMAFETLVSTSIPDNSVIHFYVPIIKFHDLEELCCVARGPGNTLLYGFSGAKEFCCSKDLYAPSIEGMVNAITAIENGNYRLKFSDPCFKFKALEVLAMLSIVFVNRIDVSIEGMESLFRFA